MMLTGWWTFIILKVLGIALGWIFSSLYLQANDFYVQSSKNIIFLFYLLVMVSITGIFIWRQKKIQESKKQKFAHLIGDAIAHEMRTPLSGIYNIAQLLQKTLPELISTEVFFYSNIDLAMDGRFFPISDSSLRAILMTDVFHHIPNAHLFFQEALRVLKPGGRICMIEPWVSPWSRWVMSRFHHEPMDIKTNEWSFPSNGPLSSSNQALPWIVFERDLSKFQSDYKNFIILKIKRFMRL